MFSSAQSAKPQTPLRDPIRASIPDLQNAELAAVYYGQRMGGDFYDFVRVNSHRVVFALLDLAGRFEENRGILYAAQESLRSQSALLLNAEETNEADAMMEICLHVNRTILQAAGGVRSCPAFIGCYNENLGTICYVNAGHPAGLVRDHSGVVELTPTGLPLGLFSLATFDTPIVVLEPGAALLLASRGLVEGKRKNEEFGVARAKEILLRTSALGAKEICVTALSDIKQFMSTPPTHNDVTVVALVRNSEA
jgi:sigma-B regulation protein RsbU (phosphoserine phosphatase)